jgi:RecG-like helicase
MHLADLERDAALLPRAREMADRLLNEAPETARLLEQRWVRAGNEYAGV